MNKASSNPNYQNFISKGYSKDNQNGSVDSNADLKPKGLGFKTHTRQVTFVEN
jgi:hypothetical protein